MKKSNEIKYFLLSDSHLGHTMLVDRNFRPEGFEEMILEGIKRISPGSVVIHLGDICMGNDAEWNMMITSAIMAAGGTPILVRGNHDHKSNTFYMTHGWMFVCEAFSLHHLGLDILFSHEPIPLHGMDINIHGHWHDNDHRKESGFEQWYTDDRYRLLSMERTKYLPVELRKFLNQ